MKVPFLKYFILKTLAEGRASGYALIKKCRETLGYTPSTGSVYPLLKRLEKDGLIRGQEQKRGHAYTITDKGRQLLARGDKVREEAYRKLRYYATNIAEIFDDHSLREAAEQEPPLLHAHFPVMLKIRAKVQHMAAAGVSRQKINNVLQHAYRRLCSLQEEKNE